MKINALNKDSDPLCRPLCGLVESYLSVDLGFRCAPPQTLCLRHASPALEQLPSASPTLNPICRLRGGLDNRQLP